MNKSLKMKCFIGSQRVSLLIIIIEKVILIAKIELHCNIRILCYQQMAMSKEYAQIYQQQR